MKVKDIDVHTIIAQAKEALNKEKGLSPSFQTLIQLLLVVIEILVGRVSKNSKNSSIPPSQDTNRKKLSEAKGKRKPGGQLGREGKNLVPFATPDEIIMVPVDRKSLPKGHRYHKVDVAKRQVVEFVVSRLVKEYHLEIVEDENGKRYTAESPVGSRPIQYGSSVKATAVYMSMYQLIPYGRVEDYFRDQAHIPVSSGSLCNFNQEAFALLADFETIAKAKLQNAPFLHTDETGINVNSKGHWLHNASNDKWTLFAPHAKRGTEAMQDIGILPNFKGTMIHDGWPAYFTYTECKHALCNAHHLRELQAAVEAEPSHHWAQELKDLLCTINDAVQQKGGVLPAEAADIYRDYYRAILAKGDTECPPPPDPPADAPKKRGRIKKTKERNLLERLRNYETETLRFMTDQDIPFTNNRGENDIRMTKVQQKISGCFKSIEGAQIFCRVRSYLLSAQKHNISATDALTTLFQGKLPEFCHTA